jgi:hypothetical protein
MFMNSLLFAGRWVYEVTTGWTLCTVKASAMSSTAKGATIETTTVLATELKKKKNFYSGQVGVSYQARNQSFKPCVFKTNMIFNQ